MIRVLLSSTVMLLGAMQLEALLFSNVTVLPAMPDIVLFATLFFALHNGSLVGETAGFISGLLLEFVGGGPFGLNCFVRTILGFTCGLFRRTLNTKLFLVPMALGCGATIFKVLLRFLAAFLFPGGNITVYQLASVTFATELGLNTVAAPVVFWILSWGKGLFILPEEQI
jgi:rod shape-determining protein MreD